MHIHLMVPMYQAEGDGLVEVVVSQKPLPIPQLRGATSQIQEIFLYKPQGSCGSQCNQSQRAWANASAKVLRYSNCNVSTAVIFV